MYRALLAVWSCLGIWHLSDSWCFPCRASSCVPHTAVWDLPPNPAKSTPPAHSCCNSDLEDGEASDDEPDFDAELATAGADSSDDEEVRAILRGSGGGGGGGSSSESEPDSGEGGSGSGSDEDEDAEGGSGSEDEGGLQLMGGDGGEPDSDSDFDLDEDASGGSEED